MKKIIKIQINSIWGTLLFEYSCVSNTIKKTLEKAVKIANKKIKEVLENKG